MLVNLDEFLKTLLDTLKLAGKTLAGKELELLLSYVEGTRNRFIFYMEQLAQGTMSLEAILLFLEGEKELAIIEMEGIGVDIIAETEEIINTLIEDLIIQVEKIIVPITPANPVFIIDKGVTINIDKS